MRKLEAIKSWEADTQKIENILKYKPKHSLKEGLNQTIEWFKKNKELYNG